MLLDPVFDDIRQSELVIGVGGLDNSDHLSGTLYKLVQRCQPKLHVAMDMDLPKFLERAYNQTVHATYSTKGVNMVGPFM
jgi:hypothetical protein